jgi:peptidoglycan/LPS O-acetylase OafA/YrhL
MIPPSQEPETPAGTGTQRQSLTYRPDIDGIRALAIFCVLLFHLKFEFFRGGYIGVDVFYVISGYLVSAQILSRLQAGTFRFAEFYSSRARRLFPALFVTIAATALASAFLMVPEDYARFSLSAVAALGSLSNILFFSEAGYWDVTGDYKPLLHTWSLGVEEQFYLLWPLVMLGLVRAFTSRAWLAVLGVATVAGLVFSEWMVQQNSSAAFYLSPFRFFQFSAGALTYLLATADSPLTGFLRISVVRWLLFLGGGLAIAFGSRVFSGNTAFPGLNALLPTLATMALLLSGAAGVSSFFGSRLLAIPPAVWLGRISYSLYLVHWPVVSLYLYHHGAHRGPGFLEQLMLLAIIMPLAVVLHYFVEKRFYRRSSESAVTHHRERSVLVGLAVAFSLLAAIGLQAWASQGWKWRFPDVRFTPEVIAAGEKERFSLWEKGCFADAFWSSAQCHTDAPVQILVLGNSLEPDAYNFLVGVHGNRTDTNLVAAGGIDPCLGNLIPVDGNLQTREPRCQQRLDTLLDSKFLDQMDSVVLSVPFPFAARTSDYLSLITSMKARKPALDIVVSGPYLYLNRECDYFLARSHPASTCVDEDNVVYVGLGDLEWTRELEPAFTRIGYRYIDRVALLCNGKAPEGCAHETPAGEPLYWDVVHATYGFAYWSGQQFGARQPGFFNPN